MYSLARTIRIVAIAALALTTACVSSVSDSERMALRHHVVAMDGEGIAIDPKNLRVFDSDAEFAAYLQEIADALRQKIEERPASEKGAPLPVMLNFHGALNTRTGALATANDLYRCIGLSMYPIFINWDASIFGAYADHLFRIRQGRRNEWLGWPTSPVYLGNDVALGAARAPVTWGYQLKNRWVADVPWTSVFQNNAEQVHRVISKIDQSLPPDTDPTASREVVHISAPDETDRRKVSLKTPFRLVAGIAKLPVQMAISPLLASAGTAAWSNYVRRSSAAIRQPHEFDVREANDHVHGWEPTGALGALMLKLGQEFRPGELSFSLVAHSTGAIIVNRLIETFPDFDYRNIVYLAAATSVDDFASVVIPYLLRNPDSRFFSVSLDPYREAREESLFVLPSGSLLEWLDSYFTKPASDMGRIMGKWENLMATQHIIPESIRGRVYLTKQPYRSFETGTDGEPDRPQTHGQMNDVLDDYVYWLEESWKGEAQSFRCPSFDE